MIASFEISRSIEILQFWVVGIASCFYNKFKQAARRGYWWWPVLPYPWLQGGAAPRIQFNTDMSGNNAFKQLQEVEEGEIQLEPDSLPKSDENKASNPEAAAVPYNPRQGTTKDLISSFKNDPVRLKYLRDSLKNFTMIKKNHYLDRKRKQPKNDEVDCCDCRPQTNPAKINLHTNVSYNCMKKCINRMISTECDDETCRCGVLCENRKFQNHEYAVIYPFPAGGKGWGLCAGQRIKKGEFIMQYIGEVFAINSEIGRKRVQEYSSSTCTYLMKTSKGQVIDPTYKGNLARFINHSCEPNCITQKWNVLGEICIGIFALKDIEENEELTFDYQFDVFNTPLTKCLCGAKKCKGYLGLRPTNISQGEWINRLQQMVCQVCRVNNDDDDTKLIICDSCNLGFHIYCLNPPMETIPDQAFFCKPCSEAMDKEKQRLDKQKIDKMKENKKISLRTEQHFEREDDGSEFPDHYHEYFDFVKMQQHRSIQEFLFTDNGNQDVRITRREVNENIPSTPEKPKPPVSKSTPVKKDEVTEIFRKANNKFQVYLNSHQELVHQINNFVVDKNTQRKKTILMNKIQMQIVKSNFLLFEKIGAVLFWDHNSKNFNDIFLKNTELSIMGTENQIVMYEKILDITNDIINSLQTQMGITEATVSIPALFLKKFTSSGHYIINQLERSYAVSIFYHRKFINDECYRLDVQAKLLLKGSKENITKAYDDIKRRINNYQIERVYLNPYQIKTILNNMSSLKRKPQMAEFRVSREPPFKDVNHPFYFIQQKNKQITLIGTRQEIEKAKKEIFYFFEEPNRKEQFNFNISLFLVPYSFKSTLLSLKRTLEEQIPSIKMMVFDPTPPRKNMTISFLGNRESRHKAREYLTKKLGQMYRDGKVNQQFELFQDQMNFQMTKYYFKYMQNTLLTKDPAFMKGWDILNGYFYNDDDNYLWKSIRKSLITDYETTLYGCFVHKDKFFNKLQKEMGSNLSLTQQTFQLIKNNMYRLLSTNQVNNTPSLKNYFSFFDKAEARRLFKDAYSYIHFLKNSEDDEKRREESKLADKREDRLAKSKSKSPQQQKAVSFFQRTILKKNKNLVALLEEQQRNRQKERRRNAQN